MDNFSTASLITRSTNDIQQVQMVFTMLFRIVLYAPILGIGGVLKVLNTDASMTWILGIAVAAILIALFCRKVKNLKAQTAFLIFVGIPVIYLFGAVQMKIVTKQPWPAIMVQAVLPFIPLDVVKCFVAAGIAKILRRVVPQF